MAGTMFALAALAGVGVVWESNMDIGTKVLATLFILAVGGGTSASAISTGERQDNEMYAAMRYRDELIRAERAAAEKHE